VGETHLIVPVPQAESAVSAVRAHHDPVARLGVPAHITVLGPFLDDPLGDGDLADLRALVAACAPGAFSLVAVARFDHALSLVPEPAEPFVALTQAIWSRWPACPPYGGAVRDIVPHLTVAMGEFDEAQVRALVEPALPIACRARELWVLAQGVDGRWGPRERMGWR
jgi:hypothetical protein